MSLSGTRIEYAIHCLLSLVDPPQDVTPSSRDMATFWSISPSYIAKLFARMEKAGLVQSVEGIRGGNRLARPAHAITVLDIVDALGPLKILCSSAAIYVTIARCFPNSPRTGQPTAPVPSTP